MPFEPFEFVDEPKSRALGPPADSKKATPLSNENFKKLQQGIVDYVDAQSDADADPQGAVLRSQAPFVTGRLRLRDTWWAGDFGAKFNGEEETDILEEAILETRAAGRALHLPEGVTGTSRRLVNPNVGDPAGLAGYVIKGAGKGLTKIETTVTGEQVFGAQGKTNQGSSAGERAFLGDADAGQHVIEIDTTAEGGLKPGDVIQLRDPGQVFFGEAGYTAQAIAGEVARVRTVDSSTQVTLVGRLDFSYAAATATWRKPSFVDTVSISGLSVDQLAFSSAGRGVSMNTVRNLFIDVEWLHFQDDPIALGGVLDFLIQANSFRFLENVFNPYGVALAGYCQDGRVTGCTQRYGRHLFTTSGVATDPGPAHILVDGNMAVESYLAAFDTHPDARRVTFLGNYAHGGAVGGMACQIRGRDCSSINLVADNFDLAINVPFGADRTLIRGGRLSNNTRNISVTSSNDVRIRDVPVDSPGEHVLEVSQDSDFPQMTGLDVDGLETPGTPSGAAFLFNTWDPSFRLENMRAPNAATEFSGREPGLVTDTKLAVERGGQISAAAAKGTYFVGPAAIVGDTNSAAGLAPFYLDPAEFGFHPDSSRLLIEYTIITNAKAPGQTFKPGLYPVSGSNGGTGAVLPTITTVVTGSQSTFTTPAKESRTVQTVEFDAPAAGHYLFAFVTPEALAAESSIVLRVRSFLRQA